MYATTFIFALMKSPASTGLFMASLFATITVPVLLYGYGMVYRYLKNRNRPTPPEEPTSDKDTP
jgi:hypothetical protein